MLPSSASSSLDGDLVPVMADAAPVMIWMADADARGTFFNKPWLDFTGRPFADQVGSGWNEAVHPLDRAACMDAYLTAFHDRRSFAIEYPLRPADGAVPWVGHPGAPRTRRCRV